MLDTAAVGLTDGGFFQSSRTSLTGAAILMSLIEGIQENETQDGLVRVRQSLEHSQSRAKLGSWDYDPVRHEGWWSNQMYVLFDRDPHLGTPTLEEFLDLIHPDDHQLVVANQPELKPGQSRTVQFRSNPKFGPIRYFVEIIDCLVRDGRKILAGTTQDVTAHKRAEQEIREFELAVENAMQGISRLDCEGRFVIVKPEYASMLGYEPDELIGQSWKLTVPVEDLEIALEGYLEMLRSGRAERECRALRKDGSVFYKQLLLVKTFDDQGRHDGHYCFMRDITERKNAELSLLDSRQEIAEQFAEVESLYRTAPVGLCLLDTDMRYVRINERLASLNGYTAQEHIGRHLRDILPEIADLVESVCQRVIQSGEPELDVDIERASRDKPDETRNYLVSYHPLKDSAGAVVAISAVVQDVTARRRAAYDLMLRQEAIAKSVTPTAFGDEQFCISYVNQAFLDLFGLESPDQVLGKPNSVFDAQPISISEINEAMLKYGRWAGETSSQKTDGTPIDLVLNAALIRDDSGKPISSIVTFWDITDRKLVQASLRESEYSLARAQQIARMGNWQFDLATGDLSGSAETYRIAGLSRQATTPSFAQFLVEHVHPEDRTSIIESYREGVKTGKLNPLDFRLLRLSNNEVRHVRVDAEMVSDDSGRPTKIIGTLQDVTRQKQVEFALRESEEKFRVLTERSPAIILIARAGRIVYCNPTLSATTGYSMEELQQLSFLDIVHPEYRNFVTQQQRRLAGEKVTRRYEIKIVTKYGQGRWLDLSTQLIDFEGAAAVLVTCVDISERKSAEEQIWEMDAQLAHVSRLSMMGEMVAGIAHEINQPLSAIANYAAACKNTISATGYPYDVPIEKWLQAIDQQAVRCGDIIRRLRTFVKKEDNERTHVDLNVAVTDSVALISSDLRQESVINCRLPEVGPVVHATHVQIQQVLVNLLRNACDATKGQSSPEVVVTVHQRDGSACVIVQDNGPGVEQSERHKLFDAFYTTKPSGMGMGLAISKSIMEILDGSLRFEPAIPSGARFLVQLPIHQVDEEAS